MSYEYEACARCGYDHEIDPVPAQEAHAACEICAKELRTDRIGELEDHHCCEHRSSHA